MLNRPQLFDFLTSCKDSRLNGPEFKILMTKVLHPQDEAEKKFLEECIMSTIKAEINNRFDNSSAKYYCQLVENAKNQCIMLEYLQNQTLYVGN